MVCVKWRVFLKQHLILAKLNRPCNFEGVAGFEKQTELPQYECRPGLKLQCPQPSFLIVFPTQMIKYLRFLWYFDVCGNNMERTS